MRTVSVDYKGKRYRFSIGSENAEEAVKELQRQLEWAERLLFYCCYQNCEVASRAISECMEIFFKRPDVYRHTIKKLAHGSRVDLANTIKVILLNGDRELLENYSGNFCEEIQGLVDHMRDCIYQELISKGVKEAELYSHVNTAFVMLEYCVKSYDRLMKELKESFHRDFSELYVTFRPSSALKKWDMMFLKLFEKDKQEYEVDLTENQACKDAIIAIDERLLDYDTIVNNIVKAYDELPDEKKTKEQSKIVENYVQKAKSA